MTIEVLREERLRSCSPLPTMERPTPALSMMTQSEGGRRVFWREPRGPTIKGVEYRSSGWQGRGEKKILSLSFIPRQISGLSDTHTSRFSQRVHASKGNELTQMIQAIKDEHAERIMDHNTELHGVTRACFRNELSALERKQMERERKQTERDRETQRLIKALTPGRDTSVIRAGTGARKRKTSACDTAAQKKTKPRWV